VLCRCCPWTGGCDGRGVTVWSGRCGRGMMMIGHEGSFFRPGKVVRPERVIIIRHGESMGNVDQGVSACRKESGFCRMVQCGDWSSVGK
jgi:hypothetical protein